MTRSRQSAAMDTVIKKLRTSPVFEPLLQPMRYKGVWGGRGSGKSHFFASLCVEEHGNQRGRLTVCIREIQKSLKESAKRTIETQLRLHGLPERLECLNNQPEQYDHIWEGDYQKIVAGAYYAAALTA